MSPSTSNLSRLLFLLLAACGPSPPMTTDGGTGSGTTSGHSSTGTTSTGPAPTTSSTTTTTDALSSTTSTDTGDTTGGFIIRPEVGPCALLAADDPTVRCSACDLWTQDCPAGEKCTPYSSDLDDVWDFQKCVPLVPVPDQVGDPCTVEGGPATGHDSCDISAMCWDVDPMTLQGTCVGFCAGAADNPMCPDGTACLIANDGVLLLCLPTCDPELPDCPEGNACTAHPNGGDAFICLPE